MIKKINNNNNNNKEVIYNETHINSMSERDKHNQMIKKRIKDFIKYKKFRTLHLISYYFERFKQKQGIYEIGEFLFWLKKTVYWGGRARLKYAWRILTFRADEPKDVLLERFDNLMKEKDHLLKAYRAELELKNSEVFKSSNKHLNKVLHANFEKLSSNSDAQEAMVSDFIRYYRFQEMNRFQERILAPKERVNYLNSLTAKELEDILKMKRALELKKLEKGGDLENLTRKDYNDIFIKSLVPKMARPFENRTLNGDDIITGKTIIQPDWNSYVVKPGHINDMNITSPTEYLNVLNESEELRINKAFSMVGTKRGFHMRVDTYFYKKNEIKPDEIINPGNVDEYIKKHGKSFDVRQGFRGFTLNTYHADGELARFGGTYLFENHHYIHSLEPIIETDKKFLKERDKLSDVEQDALLKERGNMWINMLDRPHYKFTRYLNDIHNEIRWECALDWSYFKENDVRSYDLFSTNWANALTADMSLEEKKENFHAWKDVYKRVPMLTEGRRTNFMEWHDFTPFTDFAHLPEPRIIFADEPTGGLEKRKEAWIEASRRYYLGLLGVDFTDKEACYRKDLGEKPDHITDYEFEKAKEAIKHVTDLKDAERRFSFLTYIDVIAWGIMYSCICLFFWHTPEFWDQNHAENTPYIDM